MPHLKKFWNGILTIFLTVFFGTAGYFVIEPGMSLFDAFYMTIITISTTGFKEVTELSDAGRFFTIILIVMGVSAIGYTGGREIQTLMEYNIIRKRRMTRRIENMAEHYIVCGYGRMAKRICGELKENRMNFVVIENNPPEIERLETSGYLFINGDETKDEDLIKAGIMRARGLVAAIGSDAENVFATLSAKGLNPDIFVVARALEDATQSKLKKAGADRVVMPYELGGNRMVQLLLRP